MTKRHIPNKIKISGNIRTRKFDYLSDSFIALVKNYVNLIELIENEIISDYLINDYDFIPNLGLKNELEIEKSLILGNVISQKQREELDLIDSELNKLNDCLAKFLTSNFNKSLIYIRSVINVFLSNYPNIISISTDPNKEHLSAHLSHFQDVRNDISAIVALADAIGLGSVKKETGELEQYDRALINNLKINNFQTVHYQSERYPKSYWWYHLHEVDKLSKKDLETI